MIARPIRHLLSAGLAAAMLLTAQADTKPSDDGTAPGPLHWEQDLDKIWRVDGSDAGTATDFYSYSRIIRSAGGTGPIVILNCQANSKGTYSMNLGFQIDPANRYTDDFDRSPRILTSSGVLTVDGKKKTERFRYHPDSTKIIPFDKAVAKRIYNAVVTGADVTLKAQGKTYDIELPGKDKVFVSFAKMCPITNGGNFDNSIFEKAAENERQAD